MLGSQLLPFWKELGTKHRHLNAKLLSCTAMQAEWSVSAPFFFSWILKRTHFGNTDQNKDQFKPNTLSFTKNNQFRTWQSNKQSPAKMIWFWMKKSQIAENLLFIFWLVTTDSCYSLISLAWRDFATPYKNVSTWRQIHSPTRTNFYSYS